MSDEQTRCMAILDRVLHDMGLPNPPIRKQTLREIIAAFNVISGDIKDKRIAELEAEVAAFVADDPNEAMRLAMSHAKPEPKVSVAQAAEVILDKGVLFGQDPAERMELEHARGILRSVAGRPPLE